MIPQEQLDQWQELCEKATAGKWVGIPIVRDDILVRVEVGHYVDGGFFTLAEVRTWEGPESDAAFIAEARQALPQLLAEVVRLNNREIGWNLAFARVSQENKRLREENERLKLDYIEAKNPGIDREEVRRKMIDLDLLETRLTTDAPSLVSVAEAASLLPGLVAECRRLRQQRDEAQEDRNKAEMRLGELVIGMERAVANRFHKYLSIGASAELAQGPAQIQAKPDS